MGGSNTIHKPHRGSMQYWHHVRAKREYADVRTWPKTKDTKVLGFCGYKAGMTHIFVKEQNPNSHLKGLEVSTPVTVIECPPMKVYSIRFYKNTPYGLSLVAEQFSLKNTKELARKINPSKKAGNETADFDELRLVAYTQPKGSGLGKKKPELLELGVGGSNNDEKLKLAKSFIDKELRISDILKEGQLIDVHSVTKGKGFQGTVKRFGVKMRQHKAEKVKRGVGTLGSWTPKRVQYTVAQPGKMGYHQRTEFNKLTLKIGTKPEEINPKGGFLHYGIILNDYVLIKGSVPGPAKRLIALTDAIRAPVKYKSFQPVITYVSIESKQG